MFSFIWSFVLLILLYLADVHPRLFSPHRRDCEASGALAAGGCSWGESSGLEKEEEKANKRHLYLLCTVASTIFQIFLLKVDIYAIKTCFFQERVGCGLPWSNSHSSLASSPSFTVTEDSTALTLALTEQTVRLGYFNQTKPNQTKPNQTLTEQTVRLRGILTR